MTGDGYRQEIVVSESVAKNKKTLRYTGMKQWYVDFKMRLICVQGSILTVISIKKKYSI